MLITNKQAILCASFLGSMLRKGGILADVYELCDVDLKDFSLQGEIPFYKQVEVTGHNGFGLLWQMVGAG